MNRVRAFLMYQDAFKILFFNHYERSTLNLSCGQSIQTSSSTQEISAACALARRPQPVCVQTD